MGSKVNLFLSSSSNASIHRRINFAAAVIESSNFGVSPGIYRQDRKLPPEHFIRERDASLSSNEIRSPHPAWLYTTDPTVTRFFPLFLAREEEESPFQRSRNSKKRENCLRLNSNVTQLLLHQTNEIFSSFQVNFK